MSLKKLYKTELKYRKRNLLLYISLIIVLLSYSCKTDHNYSTEKIIADYYQVFNERQAFEDFLDFYADSILLEDIVNGDKIVGKQSLRNFFDWSNPDFELLEENSLYVLEQLVNKNKAVVKGYFTAFKWGDATFEAMHFTTIFTFNESGKIVKQVDWINYPATLVNYNERKNSNEWIKAQQ
ncbi:MAG: hypothetical protein MI974_23730 [Chitinophagales bacterium]|nr:hypothetical protein [Chitinophagales bacterium]